MDGGCFVTTCAFNASGIADCNMDGLAEQLKLYTVNSTAIKSDGVHTSETGVQPAFFMEHYP